MLHHVMCIDFEASGLATNCYPIEIALADVETKKVSTWLIQPTPEWLRHGLWTIEAEEIHGLSLDYLCANGIPAAEITKQITYACDSCQVLSDNPFYDNKWLNDLYTSTGADCPPMILQDFYSFARRITRDANCEIALAQAKAAAWTRFPIMHRAAEDAQRNAEILRYLKQYARDVNCDEHFRSN